MAYSAKVVSVEAQIRDSSEDGELDPAVDERRCCKNSSSVLSCIGKRTKRLCPWQRRRDSSQRTKRGRASSSKKHRGNLAREICEKDSMPNQHSGTSSWWYIPYPSPERANGRNEKSVETAGHIFNLFVHLMIVHDTRKQT